jgi:hypothetical protein
MPVLEELQRLSEPRFQALYQALVDENGFGPLDLEIARQLRFRPQAVKKLPIETRAKRARGLLQSKRDANSAYEVFGAYLVRTHLALVTGFLDATGVAHENGMIQDVQTAKPDPAKIEAAVAALDAKHAPEDVTLYLSMCAEQWPESAELVALWRRRAGLG